jgi:hypothetical protein
MRFEDRLQGYKSLFLREIANLVPTKDCGCNLGSPNPLYINWTESFRADLKTGSSCIGQTFEEVQDIYRAFVSKNVKSAIDLTWRYIERNSPARGGENPVSLCSILFRGREPGAYNMKNIHSYFHIPFSERHLVRPQRFSVSGQPLLYLSNSIFTVANELDRQLNQIKVAAFAPKYFIYCHKRVYDLRNIFYETVAKTLPSLFDAGAQLDYTDTRYAPNKATIQGNLKTSILAYICMFPVAKNQPFTEEYVIPQMLTTSLLEQGYDGLTFPTTKPTSELVDSHFFSTHDKNIALFVNYDKVNDYDESLLDSFSSFVLQGNENFTFRSVDVLDRIEKAFIKIRKSTADNNDYVISLVNIKQSIEHLEKAIINSQSYFASDYGKMELEFMAKLTAEIESHVAP